MAWLFCLSEEQLEPIRSFFPKERGVKRVADRREEHQDEEPLAEGELPRSLVLTA